MPIEQLLKVGAKGADDLIHTAKKLEIRRPVKPKLDTCLLYTSPSPRDGLLSRMPSSA